MEKDPIAQRAILVRCEDGHSEIRELGREILGPVDFGMAMQREGAWFCIGSGVLAGGIIPGSNRLIFTGNSPVWDGFFVSTMGGAGLLWDGVGISYLGLAGRAPSPSVLVLEGSRGSEPRVRFVPVRLGEVWKDYHAAGGVYSLQQYVLRNIWQAEGSPRVLATGPASQRTRMGAICSSRTSKGKMTAVDCWAGRGGFGSRMLQTHNVVAIAYGGNFEDEDLSDRAEADGYFEKKFSKRMLLEDLEATTKYRYDPAWKSGGTFGVNYSRLSDWLYSFNYRSVEWAPEKRVAMWERLVRDHYLKQFNEETIEPKHFAHCGEPCPAVCKKLHGEYKKDYEPYQALGPLMGIFDQRAAEKVNHRADALGFDAIQIGGHLAWVMECLDEGIIGPDELGLERDAPARPVFEPDTMDVVGDSETNARLALALLEMCIRPGHVLAEGMREAARRFGPPAAHRAVYLANGNEGWMVPNQYWVPGMLAPMAVMGKYYTYYKTDFKPPLELGRACAERMIAEITTDNAGVCRFHRGWSEKLWSDIVNGHFKTNIDYPAHHERLARQVHRQGKPVAWESPRVAEIVHAYLKNVQKETGDDAQLEDWLERFDADGQVAAADYWDELSRGIAEIMGEADR